MSILKVRPSDFQLLPSSSYTLPFNAHIMPSGLKLPTQERTIATIWKTPNRFRQQMAGLNRANLKRPKKPRTAIHDVTV